MLDLPPTSRHVGVTPDDPASDGWELVAREYATAAEAAGEALRHAHAADDRARTSVDHLRVREERDLIELVYRTILACTDRLHTLRDNHIMQKWEEPT